ncbi:MAG: hypothetical protein IJ173_02840 [Kiritimatiellae bacterium]|nr:hypothetical protein [Kiritimatiellia bacterium]
MTRTILRSLFDRLGNTAAKWAACLLAVVSIGSAWGAYTPTYMGGEGTENNPYTIGSAEALAEMAAYFDDPGKTTTYIKITQSFNCSNVNYEPPSIGSQGSGTRLADHEVYIYADEPVVISGLTVSKTSMNGVGLINEVAESTVLLSIKNITLSGVTIDGNDASAKGAGAFVGWFPGKALVLDNCHVVNSTVGNSKQTGGLVGYLNGYGTDPYATFTDCSIENSTINAGKSAVGGFVGYCCVETATITGGVSSGNTFNSTLQDLVGSFVGRFNSSTTVGTLSDITASGNKAVLSSSEITDIPYVGAVLNGATYTVVESATPVAQIGETKYETIAAAVAAASTGDTIQLIADADEDVSLATWKNNAITFDLGGHTLTGQIIAPYGAKTDGIVIKNGNIVGRDSSRFYCLQFGYGSGNATLEDLSVTQVATDSGSYVVHMQQTDKRVTMRNVILDGRFYTFNSGSTIAIESGIYKNSTGLSNANIGNGGVVAAIGGTFYYNPTTPNNLVAKGYVATETTDDEDVQCWVVELGPAFAKVTLKDGTETEFWDLDEAIGALAEGATLTIKPDTYTLASGNYTLPKDVKIIGVGESGARVKITSCPTFNSANGLTIENVDFDGGYSWQPSAVTVHGDATFKNCTITCNQNAVYYSTVNGTLTFDGCTITAGVYALNIGEGTGDVIVKDCTISGWTSFGNVGKTIITGTTFEEGDYNYLRFYQDAVIDDCSFNNDMLININETGKKLIVSDSAFENGSSVASAIGQGEDDDPPVDNYIAVGTRITTDEDGFVTGGVFDKIDDGIIADGYISVDNLDGETMENYPLTVGGPFAAVILDQNGGFVNGYSSLADAIAAANDDETVKMLADVSLDVYVRAQNKKITLDLNGKTVSCGAVTTLLVDGAQLTIDDTSESGEGKVVSTSDNTSYGVVFVQNAGAIIVNAGMIVSDCAARPAIRNANAAGCSIAVAGGAVKNTAGKFAICAHGDADVTITDGAVSAQSWTIMNYGTGDIAVGGGSVSATSGNGAIENISTGNVIISGEALISASANQAIRNDVAGKVTVAGGTVSANGNHGIYNAGTGAVEISGGMLSALYYAVNNHSTGPITISGGDINAVGFAILNYSDAEVTISDGNIESVAHAVLNAANGTVTITGGSMLCKPMTGYEGLGEAAIYNGNYWGQTSDPPTTGIINISGGTIRADYRGAIENHTGTVNISGGEISSLNNAIMNFNPGGAVTISGSASIIADDDPSGSGCAIYSSSGNSDSVDITGGKISGLLGLGSGTYSITGGIFSDSPTKGVAEGYSVVSNPDPATNVVYPYAILSDYEAQIVRNGAVEQKGTLAEMVAAAQTGDTVQLLTDVTVSAYIDVNKSITLDGDGHQLTVNANRGIRVTTGDVDVTVKNLAMPKTAKMERAIQVDSDCDDVKLTIDNVTATATYYTVNVCGSVDGLDLAIKNSDLTGWGVVNLWGNNGTVTVDDSTLKGVNDKGYNADGWNNFGVIVVEGDTTGQTEDHASAYDITVNKTAIVVDSTTGNGQTAILYNNPSVDNDITLENCTVELKDENCSFLCDNGANSVTKLKGTTVYGTQDIPDLPEGYCYVDDGECKLVAKVVAQIGTTKYGSLAAAFAAAANGDTVTMLDNVTLTEPLNVMLGDKAVTLDLGGKTLAGRTNLKRGSLTIKNGTVAGGSAQALNVYGSADTTATNYSVLTIASDVNVTADVYGVCMFGATAGSNGYGAVVNIAGNVTTTGDDKNGAVFVSGNLGQNVSDDAHNVINVTGKITSATDAAIAMNGLATVNVSAGAEVTGNTAIAVKRGTLNVTDGTIHATGAKNYTAAAYYNGTEMTGAAISVSATYSQYGALAVNVSGGTVASDNADPIFKQDGTYQSDATVAVSGGYFSSAVSADYCATDYLCTTVPVANGYYQVVPAATVTFSKGEEADVTDFVCESMAYPSGNPAETTLPTPTYTAEGKTFAGWKVKDSDPEVILSAIPAGATTDYELVATWTGAQKVTITESTKTAEITVTDAWIERNVTPAAEEATTAEIQAALNKKEANGNKAWENYVLGQSPTAKLSADAGQGAISAMPVTSSAQTPKVDTGFKVQYRLDKVTAGGDTESDADKGKAQDSDVIPLDLTEMEGSVAYYKTTAIITSTDENSDVSVEVPADNTIGVLKVANAPATAMIAVPWAALDGDGAISAANLVRTANLTVGDELHYYKNGKFQSWTLGANGTWQSTKNVSDSGTTDGDAASDAKIPRGSAVWLKRQDASKPVYLVGEVGTGTAKTALEGGTEKAPAWNMVASPSVEAVDVTKKVAAVAGDRIVIPTDGAPKNYTYKGGKWGYNKTEEVTINGQVGIRSVRVEVDALESTPGVGFWYLNAGADKDVDWTSEDDQGADAN